MNETIGNLEPREVFSKFAVLSDIPRGSSHEEKVSQWFVDFAKERGLECVRDQNNNILIKKPGTPGYENAAPVILHGHMDMVCKKNAGVKHDFLNDGLDLLIDGEYVRANGTTLGADNGIGISYFLAVLDANDIPHPPLEMAITVMEEMGKVGGDTYNTKLLTGKRMIDLNWHLDDHLLAGCGGDVSVKYEVPLQTEDADPARRAYRLDVSGLKGGHCEFDIVLERANSIKLLGRLLNNVLHKADVRVASVSGGVQNNVIPAEASAVLLLKPEDEAAVREAVRATYQEVKDEYSVTDPDIQVSLQPEGQTWSKGFTDGMTRTLVRSILLLPNGVISMSFKIKGISECSNNIGLMQTEDTCVSIISTITSGVTTRKHEVMKQMFALAELAGNGVKATQYGCDAPEWEYDPDSPMLQTAKTAYEKLFGQAPFIEVMPASLELGLFQSRIKGLDIISIGTETHGVHTPEEKLGIRSVDKVWRLFREVLKQLK